MESQTLQSVPISTPKVPVRPANGIIIALFAILALLLVSTGYLYYQNIQLKNKLASYQIQTTPQVPETGNQKTSTECLAEVNKLGSNNTSGMANPASVFCICMGGKIEMRENDKGQYGMCKIGNKEYEEWQYFRSFSSVK